MHFVAEYTFGQLLAANFLLHLLVHLLLCNFFWTMEQIEPLLGTTLILVAHADDEVIAFGGLMQRMKRPLVAFATDGAPRDAYFWQEHGSRESYAEIRRKEARQALAIVGAEPVFLSDQLAAGIIDQELFRNLAKAIGVLEKLVERIGPDSLLTLAYEGGHPDHDACSFISWWVGQKKNIPVWESPLYHRNADGSAAIQMFPNRTGKEVNSQVERDCLEKKLAMFHTYKSQKLTLDGFRPEVEQFRPMAEYDFTRPPMPWKLNYELWGWTMTGAEVAEAFASYLSGDRA